MNSSEKLFTAIEDRKLSDVEKLLKNGANPNCLLLNGVTPLHLAVAGESTSSFEYLKLLLSYNGNPNVCDHEGVTPLHVAAQWDKADCLALLLHSGADLSLCDRDGRDTDWFAKDSKHCKSILTEYLAAQNECSDDVDLSVVVNFSDLSTPPSTKKSFEYCSMLQERDQNQCPSNDDGIYKRNKTAKCKVEFIKSEKTSILKKNSIGDTENTHFDEKNRYILDATSPDHCFFLHKPVKQAKILNDTLVCPHQGKNVTVSRDSEKSENFSTAPDLTFDTQDGVKNLTSVVPPVSLPCECHSNDDSTAFQGSVYVRETDVSYLKTAHISSTSLPNSSISSPCASNRAKQSIKNTLSSNELDSTSNCVVWELSNKDCQDMLLATKPAIDFASAAVANGSNSNNIVYKTLPSQSSICTFTDSTLPLPESSTAPDDHENNKWTTCVAQSPKVSILPSSCDKDETNIANFTSTPDLDQSSLPIKLSLSISSNESSDDTIIFDWQALSDQSSYEEVNTTYSDDVTAPSRIENMSDNELRSELKKYGFVPGPIRPGRKQYNKKLHMLEMGQKTFATTMQGPRFSRELALVLRGQALPRSVVDDDEKLRSEFDDPSQSTRGGTVKDSFNYLLLDPRVTQNLPERAKTLSEAEALKVFAGATFYVGKGKKSRPYAHLKEAARDKNAKNDKIQHIHEIWKTGGVVSLHVFQNVVACEAFTREAAMIEAVGLTHLTNHVRGKCYGSAHSWDGTRLRQYGTFLLIRAMQMLLLEGERQIRPHQISSRSKH